MWIDYFVIKNKNKSNKTVFIFFKVFSIISFLLIALIVLFYRGLSYDGAFNALAAKGLFSLGKLHIPYESLSSTIVQTRYPFQILNSIFLNLPIPIFISANLSNILFYFFFWLMINKLASQYESPFPYIAFISISLNKKFIEFGFGGFGEIPSLILFLYSAYFVVYGNNKKISLVFSGLLLAFSILNKWVMIFGLISYFLISLLLMIAKKIKVKELVIVFISFLTIFSLFFLTDRFLNPELKDSRLISSILEHAAFFKNRNAVYSSLPYKERVVIFFHEYQNNQFSSYLGIFKLLLAIIIFYLLIYYLVLILKKIKRTSNNIIFCYSLLFLTFLYFSWWFFLSSKPWYRRIINADILLLLSSSLIASIKTINRKTLFFIKSFLVILLFLSTFNFLVFLSNFDWENNVIKAETEKRKIISILPKDFRAYGYGWWQAPRWHVLLGHSKEFYDLNLSFNLNCKTKLDCFVFFEPENFLQKENLQNIIEKFNLKEIGSFNNSSIYIIPKFDQKEMLFQILQNYDASKNNKYPFSYNFYSVENDSFQWVAPRSSILLNPNNNNYFYISGYLPEDAVEKYLEIVIGNNKFGDFLIDSGNFSICLRVDIENKTSIIDLKTDPYLNKNNDKRNVGFVLNSVGFVSGCKNVLN